MTINASVYIATSLDGFIARADGDLDWLTGAAASAGEDHGYAAFMASVDVLVMGRNTFEKVLTFGEWPYPGKRVAILSTSLKCGDIPASLGDAVEIHPGPIPELVRHLEATGSTSIYVDGGKVIQGFLREGLIDELTITRIPVLIGSGIPLFGALERDIRLTHVATRSYENGFVQSTYRVLK